MQNQPFDYQRLNQPSGNMSEISPHNMSEGLNQDIVSLGGFNPEALYQDDAISEHEEDNKNEEEDNFSSHNPNQQYLQQPFQNQDP